MLRALCAAALLLSAACCLGAAPDSVTTLCLNPALGSRITLGTLDEGTRAVAFMSGILPPLWIIALRFDKKTYSGLSFFPPPLNMAGISRS